MGREKNSGIVLSLIVESPNTVPVILSADDDEDAHVLLKRAFVKAGATAALIGVKDGAEAIRYLAGEGEFADRGIFPLPNLLLLDLKMPKASGFEVLEYIGTQRQFQTLPVVVFSCSAHNQDVERAYDSGCSAYVVKPSDFQKLIQLVTAIETRFFQTGSSQQGSESAVPAFSHFTVSPKKTNFEKDSKDMTVPKNIPESPEMFKLLVEQVKDYAIFMLDKEGHVLSWNEGARRIKGYEAREIIGKHFSRFYPKQDIDSAKPDFELRMAQEMGRYEEEGWRVRKDGSRFWANVIITPLRDESGQLRGFAKVTRDLTQRKFQEEHLQSLLESEERFRLLVEQVKDYAIFILDAKGNIASWNQGARRIKGYSSDEIIGKHFSVFYPPEDIAADKPARELTQAIQEARYEEEGWRVRKDGSRFWASVVITSLWDKRGNLTGFAKVTKDLTDKKKEDDLLRDKTQELESFAHTLSHDLRTPLRSILSFAQILKSEAKELSKKDQELYLDKISQGAQTMDNLIEHVLQLSELGMSPAPEEIVLLDEVFEESLALLETEIRESKAQIKIQKPLPQIHANRTLLFQIFSNLIANALKFAPKGQPPKVEVYVVRKNGDCEIHVKDAGIGIPERFQESIFNLFERGDAARSFEGTGVGLAIVKKAAERLGGNVAVESKENEGSDFIVTLNCALPSPVLA